MDLSTFTYPPESLTPDVNSNRGSMTDIELTNYIDSVYAYLIQLKNKVDISSISNSATRDPFIAVVKMFISECPQFNVSFSNDYKFIKKQCI